MMALAPWLPAALGGLLVLGLGVGLPYAAVFNGAAASVPDAPASAQALVGWCGTVAAVIGPPIVGALLDATGSFAGGYLTLAAFAAVVLATTVLLRPFSLASARAAA
jgi:cyanate permease